MYLNLDENEFDSFAGDKNKSARKEKRIAEALLMGGAAESLTTLPTPKLFY